MKEKLKNKIEKLKFRNLNLEKEESKKENMRRK
jgi:hypothetical protein